MTTTRRPPSVVDSIRTSPDRPRLFRCPTVAFAMACSISMADTPCLVACSRLSVPLDDLDLHGLPSPVATLLCVAILADRNTLCALSGEQHRTRSSTAAAATRPAIISPSHHGLVGAGHGVPCQNPMCG